MAVIAKPHLFQDVTLRIWWATRWRVDSGWSHSRPISRPFTNIWYVLGGEMGIRLGQEEVVVGPNTLIIVPPGWTLDNRNVGPQQLDYLSLGIECVLGGIDIFHGREPVIHQVTLSPRALRLWELIERETEAVLASNGIAANLRLAGYARLWWSETVEHIGADALRHVVAMDPRVGQALEWMRAHLQSEIRAAEVARMLNMSESYLRQLFSTTLGVSFRRVLTDLRIQKAKRLLMTTSLQIHEVAREVGYSDPHHFTRVFSRFEGRAPSHYREATLRDRVPGTDSR